MSSLAFLGNLLFKKKTASCSALLCCSLIIKGFKVLLSMTISTYLGALYKTISLISFSALLK